MLRFGPEHGPVVVFALPLFEEANRTRAFAVAILRALAARGIGGALPDVPGQGESLAPTHEVRLAMLREAFGAAVDAVGGTAHVAAIRSGALVDGDAVARSRWRLSPQDGGDLSRELMRTKQHEAGGDYRLIGAWQGDDATVRIAGHRIATDFLTELAAAKPCDEPRIATRVVRLGGDPRPADGAIPGAPPWRRAEPDSALDLAEAAAGDIADWVRACAG